MLHISRVQPGRLCRDLAGRSPDMNLCFPFAAFPLPPTLHRWSHSICICRVDSISGGCPKTLLRIGHSRHVRMAVRHSAYCPCKLCTGLRWSSLKINRVIKKWNIKNIFIFRKNKTTQTSLQNPKYVFQKILRVKSLSFGNKYFQIVLKYHLLTH